MNSLINRFESNIQQIHNIHQTYKVLDSQTTNIIDITDVLRAEIVLCVSALDYYIHEAVRIGLIEIFAGTRAETKHSKKFEVSVSSVKEAIANPDNFDWFENEIREKHSYKSFQQANKIADAIRLISEIKLWEEVGRIMGDEPQNIKARLDLIIDRRNKIAHEADMNPSYPGVRWAINEILVEETVDFIERLVKAIHSLL